MAFLYLSDFDLFYLLNNLFFVNHYYLTLKIVLNISQIEVILVDHSKNYFVLSHLYLNLFLLFSHFHLIKQYTLEKNLFLIFLDYLHLYFLINHFDSCFPILQFLYSQYFHVNYYLLSLLFYLYFSPLMLINLLILKNCHYYFFHLHYIDYHLIL